MARRARRPRSQGAGEPDFEDRVINPCVAAGIASHLRDRPRPPLPAPWTWGHLVPLPLDLGWPYRLKSRPRDQCEGPSGAAETQSRSCALGRLCRRTRTPCGSRTGGDPEGRVVTPVNEHARGLSAGSHFRPPATGLNSSSPKAAALTLPGEPLRALPSPRPDAAVGTRTVLTRPLSPGCGPG